MFFHPFREHNNKMIKDILNDTYYVTKLKEEYSALFALTGTSLIPETFKQIH